MSDSPCNIQAGEYTHWRCQRARFHRGPHRFNNYVWGWLPRVWHVLQLVRCARFWAKWTWRYRGKSGNTPRILWRKALWPATHRPDQTYAPVLSDGQPEPDRSSIGPDS